MDEKLSSVIKEIEAEKLKERKQVIFGMFLILSLLVLIIITVGIGFLIDPDSGGFILILMGTVIFILASILIFSLFDLSIKSVNTINDNGVSGERKISPSLKAHQYVQFEDLLSCRIVESYSELPSTIPLLHFDPKKEIYLVFRTKSNKIVRWGKFPKSHLKELNKFLQSNGLKII